MTGADIEKLKRRLLTCEREVKSKEDSLLRFGNIMYFLAFFLAITSTCRMIS